MSTYYLKYYAEIQNFRGQLTRVEIHQRDTAPDSVLQIGDVCGLAMEIQGGTEDIFTPIIKTQARLSMISSDDKPTAGGIKYGGWGELYTPDATLYKFVIKTKANASALVWEPRWSGYITPDSWQEGLEYRSAITITARDNIGHLQDFEFDMAGDSYGLAKIKDILDAAMARIDMPMQVSYNYGVDIRADGTRLLDSYIAVSKFSTQSWYQVVESILDSIGYTLRYTDKNRVSFAPMRHLPLCGENSEEAQPEMSVLEFYGGNAEQVPAVKSITETHEYDYSDDVFRPILGNITYGQNQTYRCAVEGNKMPGGGRNSRPEHDAIYNTVTGAGATIWDAGSDLLNISGIDQIRYQDGSGDFDSEGGRWNQYAFLAANGVEGSVRSQAMSFFCGATDITVKASFAKNPAGLYTRNGVTKAFRLDDSLYKIRYRVWFENGDTVRHWTGYGWQNVAHTIEKEYDSQNEYATDLEIALQPSSDLPEGGVLHIEFLGITYKMFYNSLACEGVYARLASVSVTPNVTNLSKNTVKTINDEKYNVRMERQTEISPLSREAVVAEPENYSSALFYYPTGSAYPKAFPYMGNWDNLNTTTVKPIPVLVHQQILCYRGANLWQLSGECAPSGNGLFWFNSLCVYKGRSYILQSGTIDFMTGTIGGTILREFLDYEDLWDDTEEGDWQDSTEYPGSGAASTSSSAGSSLAPSGGSSFFEEDGQGGVQLKEEYAGLRTKGYLIGAADGGPGGGGGGGGLIERLWRVGDLSDDVTDFDNTANDTFNAYTINSLHTRIKALELNPGGVSSVAGLTGAVSASDLFTALGLGTAATRGVGSVVSGDAGLVTGGAVYSAINSAISSVLKFVGTTTSDISDGSTLNPIVINGSSYTAVTGNVVLKGNKEFLWNGTSWEELGDEASWALKTVTISGTGYLDGGGTLEANRTINLTSAAQTKLENGATAYGWGDHSQAGYLLASTAANTYATITALNGVGSRVSDLEKMFIDDTYTVDGQTKHRLKVNSTYFEGLITTGFLIGAADGGPGGGGGGGIDLNLMWASLQNTTPDTHATDKFHKNHLPAIVAADGISAGYTLDGGIATHLNIGISAIDMTKVSGLSTALGNKADASALAGYLPLTAGSGKALTGSLYLNTGCLVRKDRGEGHGALYFGDMLYLSSTYDDGIFYEGAGETSSTDNWFRIQSRSSILITADQVNIYSNDYTKSFFINRSGYFTVGGRQSTYKLGVVGSFNATTIYQNGVALGARAFDNTSYLPIEGGTLTGGSNDNQFSINTTHATTNYMNYKLSGTNVARIGYNTTGVFLQSFVNGSPSAYINIDSNGELKYSNLYPYLHSNNFSSYALSLSGGTLTSTVSRVLTLNATAGSYTALNFKYNNTEIGSVECYASTLTYGTAIWYGSNYVNLASDGVFKRNNSDVFYHSGNSNKKEVAWESGAFTAHGAVTIWNTTSDQYRLNLNFNSSVSRIYACDANATTFYDIRLGSVTYDSDAVIIKGSNGRMGVGVMSPDYKFHVGGVSASTSAFKRIAKNAGLGDLVVGDAGIGDDGIFYNSTNNQWFRIQSQSSILISATTGTSGIATRYDLFIEYTSGSVGIGKRVLSSSPYKLDVEGVIHSTTGVISPGYGNFAASYSSSDQRLKDDIETIKPEYAIEKLMALRPSEWVWNEKSSMAGRKGAGLVAQHVEPVLPWNIEKNGEYLSLCYDMFHPYEIGSIQFLKGETDMLKDEVAELRNRVETLESENKRLKERIYA